MKAIPSSKQKFLITGAQSHAPVNKNFLAGLERYANDIDAEIVILPLPGYSIDEDGKLDKELSKFLHIDKRTKLNNNLVIRNFDVRPQRIEPTTGLDNIIQKDESTIFASTKQRLKIIPNSNYDLPKALITTGVVTHPRYRDGFVVSKKAEAHHVYGAIHVDLADDDIYHFRQFRASSRGRFNDLGKYYDGKADSRMSKLEYMVLGDWHVGDTDPAVEKASYELIDELKPNNLVYHDFFNGHSITRFKEKSIIQKAKAAKKDGNSLEKELEEASNELHEIADRYSDKDIYLVACNHHDKLTRYLDSGDFMNNHDNIYIGAKLLQKVVEGEDPVKAGMELYQAIPDNVHFLSRTDDLKYRGWQLASHGDKGANGAWRLGVKGRERAYGKSITGHSHTPQILRDTYIVGTSTKLDLPYTRTGPSSWMNTHGLLYNTGKAQLVNIIDGKWGSDSKNDKE